MTVELKPTFIPADLHKWLKWLAMENETTVQLEHEKALREAYEHRVQAGIDNTPAAAQPIRTEAVTQ